MLTAKSDKLQFGTSLLRMQFTIKVIRIMHMEINETVNRSE